MRGDSVEQSGPVESRGTASVAIVAGGRSSRIGTNKAFLRLTPEGPRLIEQVIAATRELTDDLFIVGKLADEYQDLGVRVCIDQFGDTGVLGGIASALQQARRRRVLVVSCDMPFLNGAFMRYLISAGDPSDVVIPVIEARTKQGGAVTYQTLHAVYDQRCLPAIERQLAAGNRRVISFFGDVSVHPVFPAEARKFDPDLRSFFSVNTPEALKEAIAIHLDHGAPGGQKLHRSQEKPGV